MEGLSIRILLRKRQSCFMSYFDLAMCFRPSQQVLQSCRDETTDSLMLRSSMEEIKVSCVWAQHGEGRY